MVISLFCMYVYALYIIFQCEFSHDSDYVIQRPSFLQYMIWSSSDIIFQCEFSHDGDYIIWRLYFKILNVKTKIQDKEAHLSWDDIKAKIQDKELRLKSMSRPKSKIKKSTWDNVKAKIQNKEVRLRTMSRQRFRTRN